MDSGESHPQEVQEASGAAGLQLGSRPDVTAIQPSAPEDSLGPGTASDPICRKAYEELKTRDRNPNVQPPITMQDDMPIITLFCAAVVGDHTEQARAILDSDAMQKLFDAETTDPHKIIVRDERFGSYIGILSWVALYGSKKMLQVMLAAPDDRIRRFHVNQQDVTGIRPLEYAITSNDDQSRQNIMYLLGLPDIAINISGSTALERAIYKSGYNRQSEDIVQMLLDKGADVDISGGLYGSCLEAGCFFSSSEMLRKLISKSNELGRPGKHYSSILEGAACLGRVDIVRHILTFEAVNVNQPGGLYGSPLSAAAKGQCRSFQDPYTRDPSTATFWGSFTNVQNGLQCYHEIVKLLLEKGATVDSRGGIFRSPVTAAVFSNYAPILEELLKSDKSTKKGQSVTYNEALLFASSSPPPPTSTPNYLVPSKLISLLVETGGTDPDSRSPGLLAGLELPLEAAAAVGHSANVEYLINHGANANLEGKYLGGPLRAAILASRTFPFAEAAANILVASIDPSKIQLQDDQHCNVLHMAVFYGLYHTTQLLLQRGIGLNVRDLAQRTVLHIATLQRNVGIINLLLGGGYLSDEIIEAEDAWGRTALQIAGEERFNRSTGLPADHVPSDWSRILTGMQFLESRALGELETLHNTGALFNGPAIEPRVEEIFPPAKPVANLPPRGLGLGFQATVVGFRIDKNREIHQVRKLLLDDLLYRLSLRDIMMSLNTGQSNRDPVPSKSYPGQHTSPVPLTTQSSESPDPQLVWIHLPANNVSANEKFQTIYLLTSIDGLG